jgi:hypothetical protein
MQQISDALVRNGVPGVYGIANSWSLAQHPELSAVLDAWRAAGHYVGNHTHAHLVLTDIDAIRYCGEIDLADRHLEPWLSRAPTRYFRYTLCHWGDTEEKRGKVMAHLASKNYRPVDVTSWWYGWRWNRAWRNASDRSDSEAMAELERDFVDAVLAQLRYDYDETVKWFGRDVPMIALCHTPPFFAEVAGALFERLVAEGVVFISLDEPASDPAYGQVGKVVSGKFLVYQQKLADAAGHLIPAIAPGVNEMHEKVLRASAGPRR